MDWIKKNYDRCALIGGGLALLVSLGLAYSSHSGLSEKFSEGDKPVQKGSKLDVLDLSGFEEANKSLESPSKWGTHPGSLFVSRKYLVKDGTLIDPLESADNIHAGVPNAWLIEHELDILDPNILNKDTDGDGFSVLDEYQWKTDPNDKESRPPYYSKLRLKRYIKRPFRLKFAAYDESSYQINALDLKLPSQFLKIDEKIEGTKFRILKFEKKTKLNPSTGIDSDVSELTILNEETKEEVVLILDKVVDSPDSFAVFQFLLDNSDIVVKKEKTFHIEIEPNVEYKLIDINETEAVITKGDSEERIKVPRL